MTLLNPLSVGSAVRSAVGSAVVDYVGSWALESQLGARRNAMVASTALAARRAERQDVEAYLAGLEPRDTVVATGVASRS
jgi:hypothetical protein